MDDKKKLEQFKKNRKCQRGQVTKILNQIEDFEQKADYELKLNALKIQLELKRQELKKLDNEILEVTTESDTELTSEVETAETYQFNIIEGVEKIKLILRSKELKSETMNEAYVPVKEAPLTARLPKIELPKFTGNIIHWMPFWQSFEATIHRRKDLSQIEKLNYLISLLEEDAAQAVRGFALTAENYEDILKVLKNRYGNEERIVEHHIRKLLSLAPVKDSSNLGELQRLITEITTHIRSLKNLQVSPNQCSEILCTKIKELIPEEIMIIYERQKEAGKCSTEDLMEFLNKEMQVREKAKPPTVLDPTAKVFKPRSSAPQNFRQPLFLAPRTGLSRTRPWVPRIPGQQWSPRAPTQQHSYRSVQPVVPPVSEKSKITCYKCGRIGHYSKDCRSS